MTEKIHFYGKGAMIDEIIASIEAIANVRVLGMTGDKNGNVTLHYEFNHPVHEEIEEALLEDWKNDWESEG